MIDNAIVGLIRKQVVFRTLAPLSIFVLLCAACSSKSSTQLDSGGIDATPRPDAVAPDADERDDSGVRDAEPEDIGSEDIGSEDTGSEDTGPEDTGSEDAGSEDAAPEDAAPEDTGPEDAGEVPDAGPPAICGNNTIELGEDCDDGNLTDDGNGCSAACTNNSSCGNGTIESLFETCDPGAGACCNSTCTGLLGLGEICRNAAGECDVAETCDGLTADCPADQLVPDTTACVSCPLGNYCAGCFEGSCADSRTFCADLLARGLSTGDGVYDIAPSVTASISANTSTVSVYCDMTTDGGGWTMIYKKSRSVAGDAAAIWNGGPLNAGDLTLLGKGLSSSDYSNDFHHTYWNAFTQARVEVATNAAVLKFINFNLVGSTPTDWFHPTRHTASSWTDLPTSATWDNGSNQAFRIGGGRSFYINRVWSGCPNDRGWLMISTGDFCFWETSTGYPADIIYSRGTTESHIPTAAQTGYADTFVIMVR